MQKSKEFQVLIDPSVSSLPSFTSSMQCDLNFQ